MTSSAWARSYAGAGWRVFPVFEVSGSQCACGDPACASPGKHPRVAGGLHRATCDVEVIDAWWEQWPDANVGLATGHGLVVLDEDRDGALAELGELPVTLAARTGSGGRHLFFSVPEGAVIGNSRSKLADGLDVRGDGGYVVLPPSVHVSGGAYAWDVDTDVAPAPEWLLRSLLASSSPSTIADVEDREPGGPAALELARRVLETTEPSIDGQGGHDRLLVATRRAYDCGINVEQTYDLLRDVFNARCVPPWDDCALRHKARQAPGFSAAWKEKKEKEDAEFERRLAERAERERARAVARGISGTCGDTPEERATGAVVDADTERTPRGEGGSERVTLERLKDRVRSLRGKAAEADRDTLRTLATCAEIAPTYAGQVAETLAHQFPRADADELAKLCMGSLRATVETEPVIVELAAEIRECQALELARRARAKGPEWRAQLKRNEDGKLSSSIANVMTIMRYDERMAGVFSYDVFLSRTCFTAVPPFGGVKRASKEHPAEIHDHHVTRLVEWLEREHELTFGIPTAFSAVDAIARENSYDPLLEHLSGLQWDGVPRLDTWLQAYCAAPDEPIVRTFGAKWALSAVARAFEPGCQVDTCLVLVSDQGTRKTSCFRVLGYEDRGWFDTLPGNSDLSDKRTLAKLGGKWLLELGELGVMRRNSIETVKQFLSEKADRYIPMYGRSLVTQCRRCVFGGSTNDATPLQDHTGNRRFWPVPVGAIDVGGLEAVRDQLWAEAVKRYSEARSAGAGHIWWLTSDEESVAKCVQETYREADVWETRIATELDKLDATTIPELLPKLGVAIVDAKPQDGHRVGRCLRALGWKLAFVGTERRRVWVRGDTAKQKPASIAK